MNKAQVYGYLRDKGVDFTAVEHAAVFTVAEAEALHLPHPESGAKNLFLRDDKKRHYYLLTVRDAVQVDLRDFAERIGSRRLSFASPEDLQRLLGLTPGGVTPLGLLNDTDQAVQFWLDDYYRDHEISVHPNENTATVYLAGSDLMALLREDGHDCAYLSFFRSVISQ